MLAAGPRPSVVVCGCRINSAVSPCLLCLWVMNGHCVPDFVALIARPRAPASSGASARLAPLWACWPELLSCQALRVRLGFLALEGSGQPPRPVSAARGREHSLWPRLSFLRSLVFHVSELTGQHGAARCLQPLSPGVACSLSAALCLDPREGSCAMTVHFPQVVTLLVGCLHLAPSRPRENKQEVPRRNWPLQGSGVPSCDTNQTERHFLFSPP